MDHQTEHSSWTTKRSIRYRDADHITLDDFLFSSSASSSLFSLSAVLGSFSLIPNFLIRLFTLISIHLRPGGLYSTTYNTIDIFSQQKIIYPLPNHHHFQFINHTPSFTSVKMRTSAAAVACLVGYASAHGVVTKITGANGVEMPGLSGKSIHSPAMIYPKAQNIPLTLLFHSG